MALGSCAPYFSSNSFLDNSVLGYVKGRSGPGTASGYGVRPLQRISPAYFEGAMSRISSGRGGCVVPENCFSRCDGHVGGRGIGMYVGTGMCGVAGEQFS